MAKNRAPIPRFTTVISGLSVSVDASTSTDSDGTIVQYTFTWGDGNIRVLPTPLATHTYATSGTYRLSVSVTDNRGMKKTKSTSIPVSTVPTGIRVTSPGNQSAVSITGAPVAVTWPAAVASGGTAPYTIVYTVNGSPVVSGALFAYGTYTVQVQATDALAAVATNSFSVGVTFSSAFGVQVPATQTAVSATGAPIAVTYPPATTTGGVAPVALSYSKASGALFALGTTVVTVTAQAADGQTASATFSIVVSSALAKALITTSDISHLGMWRIAASNSLSGTNAYSFAEGPLAFRYVSGNRRWLTLVRSGTRSGHVMEFSEPVSYGTDAHTCPTLTETRSWAGVFNIEAGELLGNGAVIGGMWWDEPNGLLWYTVYPYYSDISWPVLGATRLNNDGTVTTYPMWWYADRDSKFKQICKWIVPIPASAQASVGGKTMALGADVMSIGAPANWGPGLKAITWPTPGVTTDIPHGTDFAAYNNTIGVAYPDFYCKREPDYDPSLAPTTQFVTPSGGSSGGFGSGNGYWASSMDATGCYVWVETASKKGIISMGRRGHGHVWYGGPSEYLAQGVYDHAAATANVSPDYIGEDQGGNGGHAEYYDPQLWIWNPDDFIAAASGTKSPSSVGYTSRANWKTLFPNMPARSGGFWTPAGAINASAYDPATQQFAWFLPLTSNFDDGYRGPTIQVFQV